MCRAILSEVAHSFPLSAAVMAAPTLDGEAIDQVTLNRDTLAAVMSVAQPRDAVSLAQSCTVMFRTHQALKAELDLTFFRDSSSRHVLGVGPDSAYIHLVIPEELITLITQRALTAMELHNVFLVLRPNPNRILSFVQRVFRDHTSESLSLELLVPGSMLLIAKRHDVAPVLAAFVQVVKFDVKAAMSNHALVSQLCSSLKVFYDLQISIEDPKGQSLHDMYMQIKQEFGQNVLSDLLDRQVDVCEVTGVEYEDITWKDTGLAALFGRWPSVGQRQQALDLSDICESGSAECWRFACSASQIVPVHCIKKVIVWV